MTKKLTEYNSFELNTLSRLVVFAELHALYKNNFELGNFGYKDGGKVHVARVYKQIIEVKEVLCFSNHIANEFGYYDIKEAFERLIEKYSIELIPDYV